MALDNLLQGMKEKFYDLIYKGATAFPHSSDLMHMGLIGTLPFLAGKYGSDMIGTHLPFFKEHSTALGFASSALAEIVWQCALEPGSPYDHPQDRLSDFKGIGETALGAGLGYLLMKAI